MKKRGTTATTVVQLCKLIWQIKIKGTVEQSQRRRTIDFEIAQGSYEQGSLLLTVARNR